jgi:hypothetical protein
METYVSTRDFVVDVKAHLNWIDVKIREYNEKVGKIEVNIANSKDSSRKKSQIVLNDLKKNGIVEFKDLNYPCRDGKDEIKNVFAEDRRFTGTLFMPIYWNVFSPYILISSMKRT